MSGMTEHTGYNKLDADFKAKEAEQLAKMRADLDAKRAAATSGAKAPHWMVCPKCGGAMVEKKQENVTVDVCSKCHGVYFDAGELDLLLKHEKVSSGIFGRLFSR